MLDLTLPRSSSIFIRALLLTASLAACGADSSVPCSQCPAAATTVTAHLQTTSAVLLASTATGCVDGTCQPLTLTSDEVLDWGDGWVTYGWQPKPALAPGNTFRLAIDDPRGATLLDVSRTVGAPLPMDDEPDTDTSDDSCGFCSGGGLHFDLYAASLQGQTCTGVGYPSDVNLQGDLGGVSITEQSAVTVCRNADCATVRMAKTDGPAYAGAADQPKLQFAVEIALDAANGAKGGTYEVYLEATPPEQLLDGDVYSVQLDDGSGYRHSAAATYTTNEPQDLSCITMPSKSATVKL